MQLLESSLISIAELQELILAEQSEDIYNQDKYFDETTSLKEKVSGILTILDSISQQAKTAFSDLIQYYNPSTIQTNQLLSPSLTEHKKALLNQILSSVPPHFHSHYSSILLCACSHLHEDYDEAYNVLQSLFALIGEAVIYCPQVFAPFFETIILPELSNFSLTSSSQTRKLLLQNSVWAIGQYAQSLPQLLSPHIEAILDQFNSLLHQSICSFSFPCYNTIRATIHFMLKMKLPYSQQTYDIMNR